MEGCPLVSPLLFVNESVWGSDNCKMSLSATSLAYYEMRFPVQRFIHCITLIGSHHSSNGFHHSRNFAIRVGDLTAPGTISFSNNPLIYTSNDQMYDERGKEVTIGVFGRSVAVYAFNKPLAFRWIAVFSTATDCSG